MNIGCFSGSVTFTDSGSFITTVNLYVGASVSNVYTFHVPTSNRAWCVITQNLIVNTDGSTHDGSKIAQCSSDPCTSFSLIATTIEETVSFKVKTTFTNTQVHTSPTA